MQDEPLDLTSIGSTLRALSCELVEDSLLERIMLESIDCAGADRGLLLSVEHDGAPRVRAQTEDTEAGLAVSCPPASPPRDDQLCRRLLDDTVDRGRPVVVDDASADERYRLTPYVRHAGIRSLLCVPLRREEQLIALLYLEHHLDAGVFTSPRVTRLELIAAQAAVSLENAARYAELQRRNEDLERRVEARTRELEAARGELLDATHEASMAEVASETVHNVGNVLNSVLTSIDQLRLMSEQESFRKLSQANRMLHEHRDRIPELFAEGGRGPMLLQYLQEIEQLLRREHATAAEELDRLRACATLIRDVIHVQQSYTASAPVADEAIDLPALIDNLLVLQSASLTNRGVRVERRFSPVGLVYGQRTKLMHVLLNLLKNAKQAMDGVSDKQLTLTLEPRGDAVSLDVTDNGCGIPADLDEDIFRRGFTTKARSCGLGLHSSINYMRSMKGDLRLVRHDDRPGTTLRLLLCTTQAELEPRGAGP